jgi:hypothetical protein
VTLCADTVLGLFVKAPEKGEPIRLPDGSEWYLRWDAEYTFRCSENSFYAGRKRDSLRPDRKGDKAVRTREFYVIGCTKKRQTAWNGEDLAAILDGDEETNPWQRGGQSLYARKHRPIKEKQVEALLTELTLHLPILAKDGNALGKKTGFGHAKFIQLRETCKIKAKRVNGEWWLWCENGKEPPATAELREARVVAYRKSPEFQNLSNRFALDKNRSAPLKPGESIHARAVSDSEKSIESANKSNDQNAPRQATPHRRRRGRPAGSVKHTAIARDERLKKAWDERKFGDEKSAYAKPFDVDPSYARRIIREHERGKINPRT